MILDIECTNCYHPATFMFETYDYNLHTSDDVFHYYRCTKCGLYFIFPIPDDLTVYYDSDYYNIPLTMMEFTHKALRERNKLDILRKINPGGRLLDIGAGYGSFAHLAMQAGYDVTAMEIDAACCRFMTEVVGIRAQRIDDLESALRNADSFDVITMWHVIEHLPEPSRTLKMAIERLSPNGILVIATPNPVSLQFALFKSRWVHVDAPRHLHLIPSSVLHFWNMGFNMKQILLSDSAQLNFGHSKFGWQRSLLNSLPQHVTHLGLSIFITRGIGLIISKLVSPLEHRNLYGPTYTAIYQK